MDFPYQPSSTQFVGPVAGPRAVLLGVDAQDYDTLKRHDKRRFHEDTVQSAINEMRALHQRLSECLPDGPPLFGKLICRCLTSQVQGLRRIVTTEEFSLVLHRLATSSWGGANPWLVSFELHDVHFSALQHLDRIVQPAIKTLLTSIYLRELTLIDVTIPWFIFADLPSLSSLDVENVEIEDRPGEGIHLISTFVHAEIKNFRFRNCTDIVRRFALVSPSHALSFSNLASLECDMGSLESTNYSTLLIGMNHQSLESLVLDYRANEDQASDYLEAVDINLGEIAFPQLRALKVCEVYDITEFIPCAALLEHIRTIALTSPSLADLSLIVHGFPAVGPDVFWGTQQGSGYSSFVQYGVNTVMAQLDQHLRAFCDLKKGYVRNLFMQLGLVPADLGDIDMARNAIAARHGQDLDEIDRQFTVSAPNQHQFDRLTNSIMNSSDDLRKVLSEDFLSTWFKKVYEYGGDETINIELECTT